MVVVLTDSNLVEFQPETIQKCVDALRSAILLSFLVKIGVSLCC